MAAMIRWDSSREDSKTSRVYSVYMLEDCNNRSSRACVFSDVFQFVFLLFMCFRDRDLQRFA